MLLSHRATPWIYFSIAHRKAKLTSNPNVGDNVKPISEMNSAKDLDFVTYGEGSREFCPSKTSNFLRVYMKSQNCCWCILGIYKLMRSRFLILL